MSTVTKSYLLERVHSRALCMCLIFTCFLLMSQLAKADGMIFPPPDRDPTQIFSVKYHHVDVVIDSQAAVTSVDQVFHNDSPREQEGLYMFPLVEGAVFNRFSMFAGDREVEGKILDKDEARTFYESIVRQRKDPALLEYVGRNLFRARVYPIPANGDKRIKLEYSEMLPRSGGMIKYVYPLSTERFSAKPLESVRITVHISAKAPINNIYSPSHEVDIKRISSTEATVEWKGNNLKPDRDLVLYYTVSDDTLPIQVLTHREPGGPGYFMLLASPKPETDIKPLSKDIVFVLDRTGSMAGEKIEQAKAALSYCLNALKPGDRFNLITFNENASWLNKGLVPATRENIAKALKMVKETDARGGTDIKKALQVALSQYRAQEGGRDYLVFLTDGQPTVGDTDSESIIKNTRAVNKTGSRLFVFGVGYDVNAQLLDRIARDSKADTDYVRPEENIEAKLAGFYDKVSEPVLADVKLSTNGVKIEDMYPSDQLPDMFKGGQLIVIGKYDGAGEGTFTLTGVAQGKVQRFQCRVTMSEAEAGNDFIPRLWAARKIGYLLDEIRLHNSQELIDEVVRLSKEFGIPTEFTSFLADENEGRISHDAAVNKARDLAAKASQQNSGNWGVAQSVNASSLRNATTMPGQAQREMKVGSSLGGPSSAGGFNSYNGQGLGTANTYIDSSGNTVSINTIQNIGTHTFYNRNNLWFDARYEAQKIYNIRQFSDAHFKLLAAAPELRQYSTLGEVTVVINGNAIQIGAKGIEKLTDKEVDAILRQK